jgi:hypothetical protein
MCGVDYFIVEWCKKLSFISFILLFTDLMLFYWDQLVTKKTYLKKRVRLVLGFIFKICVTMLSLITFGYFIFGNFKVLSQLKPIAKQISRNDNCNHVIFWYKICVLVMAYCFSVIGFIFYYLKNKKTESQLEFESHSTQ